MKLKTTVVILVGALTSVAWAADSSTNLNNETDKISYAIGAQMGQDFKQQNISINAVSFSQGLQDSLSGVKTKMDQVQIQETLNNFRKKIIEKKQAEYKALSDENKKQGEKFLTENKSKSGVVTLPDGLQYKITKAGAGVQPQEGDSVTVNYSGKFLDGKEFDSSYQRGKPATFVLSKDLIPAWVEVLQKMKAGTTVELYVPASLGYGDRGVGPIGPNQMLTFKIELLSVKKGEKK